MKENDITTTFFLCGYWIDEYPEIVKKIAAYGHDIGNHGNTHAHGAQLSYEQNVKEIIAVHKKIKDLTGIEMHLFRPPFGEYNNTVIKAAEDSGYYVIQWDVDSLDWKEFGTQQEISHVLEHKNLQSGSIILFHNDAKYTPLALESIIKGLNDKNLEIVPVSELIYTEDYYMNNDGKQYPNNSKK